MLRAAPADVGDSYGRAGHAQTYRSGRLCKPSHGVGCSQRTENPPALAVGSVKYGKMNIQFCCGCSRNRVFYCLRGGRCKKNPGR